MYFNTSDYDPSGGQTAIGANFIGTAGNPLSLKYPGITDGGAASVFLSGVFSPGSTAGDLVSTYTSTFSETKSFAGQGQGFMDITGGSAQTQFDTSALTDLNGQQRDLFLDVTFNDVNGAASSIGWSVTSAGQLKGNATPEPGALALSALALFAAGLASRRRASA
jgi:hypothetical protein